ncbi:MAG: nitroreductase family protein [Vallitaleaceae bacterium]|jgi:FMN reductase (NADPH)|nr:nitroreductase family protein [Vallitaleaceae bacterium]
MNKTIELLNNHKSIRKFNELLITPEEEQAIIHASMRGATAGNMMPYSIIKIRSKETLAKLADSCDHQPFIESAALALLYVVDNSKWHRLFELRDIKSTYTNYEGPVISDMILGMQDTMIAAQNAVIAAESLGIGTCYIGDILEHNEYHRELFNLPDYVMPATLIVMGRFDLVPKLRDRFDQEHIVFDEVYPDIDDNFINSMYKEKEKDNPDFAKKFYDRKMNADFFREKNRSLELYIKAWQK